MGMFGGAPRRMFDTGMQRRPWDTPGYGDGSPSGVGNAPMPAYSDGINGGMPVTPDLTPAPGFFSRGGVGVDLLGGISDGVLALNGMQPVYGKAQDERRKLALVNAQYQRKRQDEQADWIAQKEWERAHPAPTAPHYFEANNGDQGAIDPRTGQVSILYKDPTPKVDYTPVKNADGTTTLYPTINGQMVGAGRPALQRPAIGATIADPRKGGAAPQARAPFPLRPLTR